MSRHGGSGGAETGGDTRFRGEQDRFTRPSIKKKLAQKRAEESNPRNATQLWNRSTKPFDASVRVAITRNKTETGPSFLLLLFFLLSLSLSFQPFLSFFFSPLDTGAVAPPQSCEQNSLENLRAQVRFETRRIPTQFAFKGRIARPKFQCTCSPHAQACEARTRA